MIRNKSEFALEHGNLVRRGKKGMIYARFMVAGRRYLRKTDRFDEAGARIAAWAIYNEAIGGRLELTAKNPAAATVEQCLEIYIREAPTMERPIKPSSARNAASAVRSVCAALFPGKELGKIQVSQLDEEAARKFRLMRRQADGVGASGDLSHNYRINRVLARAASVFGKEIRKTYTAAGLHIPPDVLTIARLREPKRLARPVSGSQVWRAHLGVARRWKAIDPRRLVVFELMRYCGLRDSEVLAMRWHWIRKADGIAWIDIINREESSDPGRDGYRPKNHRDRSVPVRLALIDRWARLLPSEDPYGYVIPATQRSLYADWWRELSTTVRTYWPDRSKSLYELRRYAGSAYLSKTRDIPGTAAFLGDTIQITYANYAWLLDESSRVAL